MQSAVSGFMYSTAVIPLYGAPSNILEYLYTSAMGMWCSMWHLSIISLNIAFRFLMIQPKEIINSIIFNSPEFLKK